MNTSPAPDQENQLSQPKPAPLPSVEVEAMAAKQPSHEQTEWKQAQDATCVYLLSAEFCSSAQVATGKCVNAAHGLLSRIWTVYCSNACGEPNSWPTDDWPRCIYSGFVAPRASKLGVDTRLS